MVSLSESSSSRVSSFPAACVIADMCDSEGMIAPYISPVMRRGTCRYLEFFHTNLGTEPCFLILVLKLVMQVCDAIIRFGGSRHASKGMCDTIVFYSFFI